MGLRARVARAAPEGRGRATWRAAAALGSIAGTTLALVGGALVEAQPAVAVRSATPAPAAQAEPLGRWSTAARLAPPGTVLTDLSCSSAHACMAVGDQPAASSGAASMAAYVWNGRSWRAAPVPAGMHAGLSFAELTEVSCASADDCLAAGLGFASVTSPFRYDVLHWNGRRWSRTGYPLTATRSPAWPARRPSSAWRWSTRERRLRAVARSSRPPGTDVAGGSTRSLGSRSPG